MNAAREIQAAAGDVTAAEVARVVGEPPSAWRRYLSGAVSPSVAKVEGWLARWREAGRPELVVTLRAT